MCRGHGTSYSNPRQDQPLSNFAAPVTPSISLISEIKMYTEMILGIFKREGNPALESTLCIYHSVYVNAAEIKVLYTQKKKVTLLKFANDAVF